MCGLCYVVLEINFENYAFSSSLLLVSPLYYVLAIVFLNSSSLNYGLQITSPTTPTASCLRVPIRSTSIPIIMAIPPWGSEITERMTSVD